MLRFIRSKATKSGKQSIKTLGCSLKRSFSSNSSDKSKISDIVKVKKSKKLKQKIKKVKIASDNSNTSLVEIITTVSNPYYKLKILVSTWMGLTFTRIY